MTTTDGKIVLVSTAKRQEELTPDQAKRLIAELSDALVETQRYRTPAARTQRVHQYIKERKNRG